MERHFDSRDRHGGGLFTVGRGIGKIGRWARLLLGLQFLTFLMLNAYYFHPVPQEEMLSFTVSVIGYIALISIIYVAVFSMIGELVLSKMNPWTGTVIFLGIPTVLGILGYLPPPVQMAFGLYVSISLILVFFMRYGGCEVVALPSLLSGRRFTMYCPFNAIDAVERAVTPDESIARHPFLAVATVAITAIVGGFFFLQEQHILANMGVPVHLDSRWSLLLLIPLAHLVTLTVSHCRLARSTTAPKVRKFGLGAVVLGLAMIAFLSDSVSGSHLWRGAMALGAFVVLVQIGVKLIRRLRTSMELERRSPQT